MCKGELTGSRHGGQIMSGVKKGRGRVCARCVRGWVGRGEG